MTAQYAFFFDARFCSGCKACQAACKDKNDLPPGVLWRRVMEVAGGTWQSEGIAWSNTVFAYNLSIACNHCLHPKCAGICPANAFVIREDGIIILDETRCMGCGYCAWGCPYDVPQYNPEAGHMSKCDLCYDQLDQGLPPACVAACPLRTLDYRETTGVPLPAANAIRLWEVSSDSHPYPLPAYSHTQPRLAIQPHPGMLADAEKYIANREEIQPRKTSSWEEMPLLLFTLLGQMAAGGIWAMTWMFQPLWSLVEFDAILLRLIPTLIIGACLGAGMLASLTHLGTKKNAWRVFSNLRRSSISKEVLFTGVLGLSWLLILLSIVLRQDMSFYLLLASAAGLGLVYHMAQVYRLPAAPGWNTWRTNAGFMVSAALLGVSIMTPLVAYESGLAGIPVPTAKWMATGLAILLLLLAQLILVRKYKAQSHAHEIRVGLILVAMGVTVTALLRAPASFAWWSSAIPLLVIGEEVLGRWVFYRSRM